MLVQPISREALVSNLAERVLAYDARIRVAVDGAPTLDPGDLGAALTARLRDHGRFAIHVSMNDFLLPASQRYELGRTNPDGFYEGWRDLAGLKREVLDPSGVDGIGRVLPALWRTDIDRSARAAYVDVPPAGVVVVTGEFLLGAGLPFELEVHLDASAPALARRMPQDQAWTLPAYERYREEVMPATFADIVVRMEDPNRPALVVREL
jgi:hypothetical protein